MPEKLHHQLVGNAGLYYVCYELSKRGWNALPTSRNAKGVDVIIYNQDASKTYTIQVKSLSQRNPVPCGSKLDNLIADFLIVCRYVQSDKPEIFIAKMNKIKNDEYIFKSTNKSGEDSYWIQPPEYEEFIDNWKIIGNG